MNAIDLATPQSSRHTAPIGIFDSGIGGLSVALEVMQHLPNERILYYADTANVPYGNKSNEEIQHLTTQALAWLHQQGCKIAIVACNSASAFSLAPLREFYGEAFPIIGLVPAVKPAVLHSKSKVVAVLATAATFRGRLIQQVIDEFAVPANVQVVPIICAELVPLIEQGKIFDVHTQQLLQHILAPAIEQGADHLVLGCTHYPFLKAVIEQLYPHLTLIDSGQAVSRQCGRILSQYHLQNIQVQHPENVMQCVFSGNNCDVMHKNISNFVQNISHWQFINLKNFANIQSMSV